MTRPPYIPNVVPFKERVYSTLMALFMIAAGAYAVHVNDFPIRLRRGRLRLLNELHLHDFAVVLMFVALVFGALILLLEVADHYDRRDNEHHYHALAQTFTFCGLLFLAFALGLGFLEAHLPAR